MRYGVVYRITNLETGKCYIGRTKNPLRVRWQQHCYLRSRCLHLNNAIQKYGKESFSIHEIASSWNDENLRELEVLLIKQENTLTPNGYNLININTGPSEISEETRQRLSEAQKGKISPMQGRTHTIETKQKISIAKKGKTYSEEIRKNMGGHNRGKTTSDEIKKKMSQVMQGLKWYTDGVHNYRIRDGEPILESFRKGLTRQS